MILYKFSLLLLAGIACLILLPAASSFAQSPANSTQPSSPIYNSSTTLQNPNGGVPVLEKLTDKGLYRVQLKWDSTPLNPKGEFDMQVLFLNASSPHSNSTNLPQQSNYSGYSVGPNKTAGVVTDIIDKPIAVESYDIAIYDNQGHVLFQKTKQPGAASAAGVTVSIKNYTGPVTIAITNITAAQSPFATATSSNNPAPVDSVKFSAAVAPEFPANILSVAAAVGLLSAIIAVRRLSGRQKLAVT